MRAAFFALYLLLVTSTMAMRPDTSRQDVKIYRAVETYTSDIIYFTDSAGNTEAAFSARVVVKLFARQNYVHLMTDSSQAVYPIIKYEVDHNGGKPLRKFFVADVNVGLIVLDAKMNIYFVRHDGQMMIIPARSKIR